MCRSYLDRRLHRISSAVRSYGSYWASPRKVSAKAVRRQPRKLCREVMISGCKPDPNVIQRLLAAGLYNGGPDRKPIFFSIALPCYRAGCVTVIVQR